MMKRAPFITFLILISIGFETIGQNINSEGDNGDFQVTRVEPSSVVKVGEGHYFIDFGKSAFGTLEFLAKAEQSDAVIFHLGERITHPTTIDRNPEGTIRYQKVVLNGFSKDSLLAIKLKADERNSNPPAVLLPDTFDVIMPFRYCEIENLSIPISDLIIHQKRYHYRFNENNSDFISSDTVLNQVWDLCKYTIKATSFSGLYVDGDRERIPYEADAFINQLSHYSVDNEYDMARNTNEYFMSNPTWPTEWILHTVLLFYYDYLYTGDIAPLKKHYDALKRKTLYELAREDGLISSTSEKVTNEYMKKLGFKDGSQRVKDIVDWPPAQKDTGWKLATPEGERDGYEMTDINTVVNSFYYINLKLMAVIAGALDEKQDSVFFYTKSIKVKNTINQKLFDSTKRVYIDGENSQHSSLHANMFPLAFGLVPQEQVKSVAEFIKSRGMACSVYGAQYFLEALYKANEADYALGLMTAQNDRSWWNMIRIGSTMALEAWDIRYKPNLDWNHAWGTAPANIITRFLWGITPTEPGFDKVQIKPQMSDLSFSKIKAPTIKGSIEAEYEVINGDTKKYLIALPDGVVGEFLLPSNEAVKIFLNNKRIKPVFDFLPLGSGSNVIEIRD